MKKLITIASAIFAVSAIAAPLDLTGDFEKVKADAKGNIAPVGWIKNRIVSKDAEVCASKDEGCFRNGKFGLTVETAEKGCLSFRAIPFFEIAEGDTIKMEIYAKGSGRYSLQYIAYGLDAKNSNHFISTLGIGRTSTAAEKWSLHSGVTKFSVPKKAVGKYNRFAVLPVIFVNGNAEICFDDFKMEIIKAAK